MSGRRIKSLFVSLGRLWKIIKMKSKLIYLASPYSHPKKHVRLRRWHDITLIGALLIQKGHHVFGPITESHCYSEIHDQIGKGWDFWKKHDELMLSKCDELWVVLLEGWKDSAGVAGEINYAKKNKLPIKYLEPVHLLEGHTHKLNFVEPRLL